MQGFVKSYFQQQRDLKHSQKIMYYFPVEKLPVLTTLATEFAVFNRWLRRSRDRRYATARLHIMGRLSDR